MLGFSNRDSPQTPHRKNMAQVWTSLRKTQKAQGLVRFFNGSCLFSFFMTEYMKHNLLCYKVNQTGTRDIGSKLTPQPALNLE